jgi:hypothetical protein
VCSSAWQCRSLKWEEPLAHFKQRVASGEDVFGALMDRFLLNNNHRVTVITLPDSQLAAQTEAKEKQRIDSARSQMSAEDVRAPRPLLRTPCTGMACTACMRRRPARMLRMHSSRERPTHTAPSLESGPACMHCMQSARDRPAYRVASPDSAMCRWREWCVRLPS